MSYKSRLKDHIAQLDPVRAVFIKKAFELYATGEYTMRKLSKKLYEDGLRSRKGHRVGLSAIGKILNNPFYYGDFIWKNKLHHGHHEPIITKDLFEKVQYFLSPKKKSKGYKHDFAYTGLMVCGEYGNGITAEKQKGHIY